MSIFASLLQAIDRRKAIGTCILIGIIVKPLDHLYNTTSLEYEQVLNLYTALSSRQH